MMRLNKHFWNARYGFFILAISAFVNSIIAASSPLDYKTFVNGSSLWICNPAGILLYRNDTKSARSIVLCDTVDNDSIFDVAENNAALWALARSGVYQIDLSTTTVEKLPGAKKGAWTNKLAVDDDYLWITLNDTLWRFDKLGREWFPYFMNTASSPQSGLFSSGTNVYCVLPSSIKIFSTKDEKWLEFPYKKGMSISAGARFFLDKNTLILVDGPIIYRYLINSQSWDVITAQSPVIDMLSQDTALYYLTASGMFKYLTVTAATQPEDVPEIAKINSFSRLNDTLICATNANFIKYDMHGRTSDNLQAPQNISEFIVRKTIMLGGSLFILCPQNIGIYDSKTQAWENIPLSATGRKRHTISWNDDNGLKLTYAKGYESQLRGSIQKDYIVDSLINKNDSTLITYTDPVPILNLTLHTAFPEGRYLDAFFDNSDLSQLPRKGLFYRGAALDRVESARLGTNKVDIAQSKTLLPSLYEGGNAIFQSKTSLATRDRRIIKAQAGAGYIVSQTINKILPYSESGLYSIKETAADSTKKSIVIVPGSLKISIDGEEIDSSDFSLVTSTGSLKFNRLDLLDPTSVIAIAYQIRTMPDSGIQHVDVIPENNFGKLGYGSVSVSPTDWISPQAGYYYLKTDTLHQMVNLAAPAEVRSSNPALFLKINPELTYDAATRKKAAALAMQSRFGEKLSLLMNGLLPDSGFKTTDNLDRGYGSLKHDADFKASYDVTKELPVSYYQRDIASVNGVEKRYELAAGSHFQNFPFCDLSLSRNIVDGHRVDTIREVTIDSTVIGTLVRKDTVRIDSIKDDTLDRLKDKFRVRLYETSSPFIESALHINHLNYELSYTGFSSKKEHMDQTGYGSIFYGNGTVSPIKRLTLSATGTYLKNPQGSLYGAEYNPVVYLQTIDAPTGIDLYARNELTFKSLSDSNASTAKIKRVGTLTIKPGSWLKALGWISPIVGLTQQIQCNFNENSPDMGSLLYGNTDVKTKTVTRSIGANIFPTNDIIFHNDNQFTTADSSTKYYAYNDVKWWFGDKRMWQTHWEYDRDRPRFLSGPSKDFHRGYTQFTDNWNSWLQTITGVSSDYTITDTGKVLSLGPNVNLSISKQNMRFIRNLMNTHMIGVTWTKENGDWQPTPNISYSLFLKIVVFPNISLTTNDAVTFSKGAFVKYNGMVSAAFIF